MTKYALIALLSACLGLGGFAWYQQQRAAVLRAENEILTASLQSLERQRDQAREAAEVAQANAKREAQRAAEYDSLRESLLRGGNDADLPEWFRAYMRDLGFGGRIMPTAN